MIKKLDWDSNFFGYQIGKTVILKESSFDFEIFKRRSIKYKLIYIYSEKKQNLENFELLDRKVTFYQELAKYKQPFLKKHDITIKSFDSRTDNLDSLINLSIESGIYSRFNLDKKITNSNFERLYREWVLNSINGKLAFEVFVAKNVLGNLIGFITLGKINEDVSEIGLIAVDKNERGKGVAQTLIERAIQESILLGYKKIEVVTQKDNIPAMKLYSRAGFLEKETTYIYHYWNL
ncbi:GNAT family N-acetyltransferase [Polaribacter cellanae]|uniref:GNAT family N-acetyltransferase n=1 Tax=Polaribacter cellanae TaxID=2818493 RepID=A0A975H715_9FLAO|nr:GNAT family N-acetyltransferase [Polaribacter cellanae]QTE22514.1 GNAT family N-acetyltransferase [Polaribacter cellanae]